MTRKNIFVIIGSASQNSANQKLVSYFARLTADNFILNIWDDLRSLPHFDPEASGSHPPGEVTVFRERIAKADGVLICTPEYIFSIPSGLKNAIEWCVATTIFTNKPVGLITASASGMKAHEELILIMQTLMAEFTEANTLLIQGIKGKINEQGQITDQKTEEDMARFANAYKTLLQKHSK